MDDVADRIAWSERIFTNLAAQIGSALPRILSGVAIILLFLVLAWLFRRILRSMAGRFDLERRPLVSLGAEAVWFTGIALGLIVGFGTMGVDVTALVAGLASPGSPSALRSGTPSPTCWPASSSSSTSRSAAATGSRLPAAPAGWSGSICATPCWTPATGGSWCPTATCSATRSLYTAKPAGPKGRQRRPLRPVRSPRSDRRGGPLVRTPPETRRRPPRTATAPVPRVPRWRTDGARRAGSGTLR